MAAVAAIHLLDDALAPLAAGQVDVDVGPALAALRQEALEEHVELERVDRRDPQAEADGAVGRAAPTLGEDALVAAEADDVGDDQEIAGEPEPSDQGQLLVQQPLHPLRDVAAVAAPRAAEGPVAQNPLHGLAGTDRVARELVAQVFEGELQPIGQPHGLGHRLRQVAEEPGHGGGGLEVRLAIDAEVGAGRVEVGVVAQAGEDIEHFPALGRGLGDPAGGQQRHPVRGGEVLQRAVPAGLAPEVLALDLGVHLPVPEGADDALHHRIGIAAGADGPQHRALQVARERDQACGEPGQFVPADGGLVLGRAQVGLREQSAEVPVALARAHQHRQHRSVVHRQFRAEDRPDALLAGGVEDPWRAVKPHAIAHRQRRQAQAGGGAGELLGQRGAAQEAERAPGVQFDVGGFGRRGGHWASGFSQAGRRHSNPRAGGPAATPVRAGWWRPIPRVARHRTPTNVPRRARDRA